MKVVVTNDDGIESEGLDALTRVVVERGWEVTVIAPDQDVSGSSAAIWRCASGDALELRPVARDVGGAAAAYTLNGPPGLAALVACRGAMGEEPDLVLSGANIGANTGHAILHSGTVGAALTAASFGVSALAVSAAVARPMRWERIAGPVHLALDLLVDAPKATVLSLNVPEQVTAETALRWARLDRFGAVRVAVGRRGATNLQLEYRDTGHELDPECDTALLAAGFATLTALEGITATTLERREVANGERAIEPAVVAGPPSAGNEVAVGQARRPVRRHPRPARRDAYGEPIPE